MLDYSVRESKRASNVRLKVSADEGLVVVIPDGFDTGRIGDLLRQESEWIDRAQRWAREQRQLASQSPGAQTAQALPLAVELAAIEESWSIDYRPTASTRIVARDHEEGLLRVSGNTGDIEGCIGALRRWIARKAHHHLVPRLRALSQEEQLSFGLAQVGNQKTRWASCSPLGTISINQKLLFLPPRLVHYVFIHELCHLVHLNHSSRYWSLVGRREPSFRQLERDLRDAWRQVPAWMGD